MPVISISNPASGLISEGGDTTVAVSLEGTGYAFESETTLAYRVVWDFHDQEMWSYYNAGCLGQPTPNENSRTMATGHILFTPGDGLTQSFTIPPQLANGLRDPSRFARIDFDWVQSVHIPFANHSYLVGQRQFVDLSV